LPQKVCKYVYALSKMATCRLRQLYVAAACCCSCCSRCCRIASKRIKCQLYRKAAARCMARTYVCVPWSGLGSNFGKYVAGNVHLYREMVSACGSIKRTVLLGAVLLHAPRDGAAKLLNSE